MSVLFLPEIIVNFLNLVDILYDKGYFGFEENAVKYVRELFLEIEKEVPFKQKKKAPKYFDKYYKGMYYSIFKRNKNTSWYVFYNIFKIGEETVFFIRLVENNHRIAQFF